MHFHSTDQILGSIEDLLTPSPYIACIETVVQEGSIYLQNEILSQRLRIATII